jgi:hypothetical protein
MNRGAVKASTAVLRNVTAGPRSLTAGLNAHLFPCVSDKKASRDLRGTVSVYLVKTVVRVHLAMQIGLPHV